MHKREEWMGEVGDGGKEGAVTRGEGLGRVSEDGQRLKKNYCYQLGSVFAFITVHRFPSPRSEYCTSPHFAWCLVPVYTSVGHHK